MKAKRNAAFTLAAAGMAALALAPHSASAQGKIPEVMTAAVPPEGSTGYVLTAAITKVVTEKTPIKKITLQTFGGAAGWPARMQTGEVDFGSHCGFKQVEEAYYGEGAFAKVGRQKNVLNMISGHGLPFAMSVTDASVKKVEDLKGKAIFAMMTHFDQKVATEVTAKVAGLQVGKTLRVIPVRSPQEAIQGMLTGRASGFYFGTIPGLVEVQKARGLRAIPLTKETMDAVLKAEPVWGTTVIKAGSPPLKPETDIPTLQIMCGLAAGAKTSDEAVYVVTKTVFENHADWAKVHPLGRQWELKNAASVMNAPYHNGAIRYFREKGVWTAENDKKQQALLAK